MEVHQLRLYHKQPTKLICQAIALGSGGKREKIEDRSFKFVPVHLGTRCLSTRVPGYPDTARVSGYPRVPHTLALVVVLVVGYKGFPLEDRFLPRVLGVLEKTQNLVFAGTLLALGGILCKTRKLPRYLGSLGMTGGVPW